MCVYVIRAEGGDSVRLTYHPGDDFVRGWTPDSNHLLFATSRDTPTVRYRRLYTVKVGGSFPQAMDPSLPTARRSPTRAFLSRSGLGNGIEGALRHWSWVEANRKRVDELSNGRVAYVYMPNTAAEGYASFSRYYFSQLDKEAGVLDERFNGGGMVADYVIDMLDRSLLCHWATREGDLFHSPNASILGPKAMIVNEYAGSGGDAMPLFFRWIPAKNLRE